MTNAISKAYSIIAEAGLDISAKSLIVASSKQLARETRQQLLAQERIVIQAADHAKDLGAQPSVVRGLQPLCRTGGKRQRKMAKERK